MKLSMKLSFMFLCLTLHSILSFAQDKQFFCGDIQPNSKKINAISQDQNDLHRAIYADRFGNIPDLVKIEESRSRRLKKSVLHSCTTSNNLFHIEVLDDTGLGFDDPQFGVDRRDVKLSALDNVDVKAEISHVDCSISSSRLYMNIFIRKAEEATQDIFLEDQNYRFNFNTQSLFAGSFFIDTEGELLSGFNINADGSAYIFGDHHITGSINNILSYNIEYQGGTNGLRLEEEWIRVGTIGATLLTNIECITSDVLTISSFPSTTIIYKHSVETTAETIIDKKPNTYNLGTCINTYCNACVDELILTNGQDDYVMGEILEHKVSEFIEAKNVIGEGARVTYNVKNNGELLSEFEIKKNADFELKIGGCQN